MVYEIVVKHLPLSVIINNRVGGVLAVSTETRNSGQEVVRIKVSCLLPSMSISVVRIAFEPSSPQERKRMVEKARRTFAHDMPGQRIALLGFFNACRAT
jgi:hypothetical protein